MPHHLSASNPKIDNARPTAQLQALAAVQDIRVGLEFLPGSLTSDTFKNSMCYMLITLQQISGRLSLFGCTIWLDKDTRKSRTFCPAHGVNNTYNSGFYFFLNALPIFYLFSSHYNLQRLPDLWVEYYLNFVFS